MAKKSHRDRVLNTLWDCKWHTFKELASVGGIRHSARILELRRLGYDIEASAPGADGNKKYRLLSKTVGAPQAKRVKVFLKPTDAFMLLQGRLPTASTRSSLKDAYESFKANEGNL